MAPAAPIEYTGRKELTTCIQTCLGAMKGKARKVSRGYSSGFVPDFRHTVETLFQSQGIGSSGPFDMEMTASENSCGVKRKVVSPDEDAYSGFVVPSKVLSLKKMSQSERRDLARRLKRELEQVRVLQKRIASFGSNVGVPPSNEIHNYHNTQKRPAMESFQNSREVSASMGRKGARGHGIRRTKCSTVGRFGTGKKAVPNSTSIAMLMKQCEALANKLLKHCYGCVFAEPVDPVELNIPDYFDVIKHPMDLGTVKRKLLHGEYLSLLGFAEDVRLAFSNAIAYNPKHNDVHVMAQTLSKFFEARWKPIEKKLAIAVDSSMPSISAHYIQSEISNQMPGTEEKASASINNTVKNEPVKHVMSDVERHKLSTDLEALLEELPEDIIIFLKEQCYNASQTDEDEIEIDVNDLSDDTLFALRELLDNYLLGKRMMQGKAESCKMELHNRSSFSNSSVQPCKGNDPVDEVVDIGGKDPPTSSYPPVEIEKDAVTRNSKCSSSSSSSSGSDSSSSDSDSDGSSGSELDGGRASAPALNTKENIDSRSSFEPKMSDIGGSVDKTDALSGSNQIELSSKGVAVEVKDGHEGEGTPPGRQVSPEKLYRAAWLRSRFADTILKAQEKTLEKGERHVPEKLRLEGEELERRRREEKARLLAEAQAAEEARRKAESEAAAEAKRKRGLEREAARQALQAMEKTVNINENCGFMEDLEMLRAAPVENSQCFTGEATTEYSESDLGGFKFQENANPLEQLGLYMKMDDEEEQEEEEPEPQNATDASNDADAGETD